MEKRKTFGLYRGGQVYLMHVARDVEGVIQLPMICKLGGQRIPAHYQEFLERKTQEGYTSETLIVSVENETVWTRPTGSNRYVMQTHPLMAILNRFKKTARLRLALNRLRQRARARRIHEELVSVVWSPAAFQKRLDMGLTIDEVCDL